MSAIIIDGQSIDAEDPCALWQAIYAVKLRLAMGAETMEIEIRSSVTTRRVRKNTADLKFLDQELARLQVACEAKRGRRARFAPQLG